MSVCDSYRALHGHGAGVDPSDNYFPDSRSRYGESLVVNSRHIMQSMVITLHPSLSNAVPGEPQKT